MVAAAAAAAAAAFFLLEAEQRGRRDLEKHPPSFFPLHSCLLLPPDLANSK